MPVDARVIEVLNEFEARNAREEAALANMTNEEFEERIDEFLLPVGPATGRLLNLLVRESGAKSVLEIGASHGYSTVWLAEAARATGGVVHSLELSAPKISHAGEALARAGLAESVVLHETNALDWIESSDLRFDFVLLDLWKNLYVPCLNACLPRLVPGALVVADNMLEPESARFQARRFQHHVRGIDSLDSVLLPVGSGLLLCRHKAW